MVNLIVGLWTRLLVECQLSGYGLYVRRLLTFARGTVSMALWKTESVSDQNTKAMNEEYGGCSSATVTALSSNIHRGVLPNTYRPG